jgi:hypothetical protein
MPGAHPVCEVLLLRPSRRVASLVTAASAAVLVAACTDSSAETVDLEGLESGPCADLIATLEDVDAGLRGVAEEEITPEQAAERFAAIQGALAPAATDADAAVRPAVTELITSLGFFRVAVDARSYDGEEDGQVRSALSALAEDCRTD